MYTQPAVTPVVVIQRVLWRGDLSVLSGFLASVSSTSVSFFPDESHDAVPWDVQTSLLTPFIDHGSPSGHLVGQVVPDKAIEFQNGVAALDEQIDPSPEGPIGDRHLPAHRVATLCDDHAQPGLAGRLQGRVRVSDQPPDSRDALDRVQRRGGSAQSMMVHPNDVTGVSRWLVVSGRPRTAL